MSKPLDRLTLLQTFSRIAESGSLSAAGRDLNLSQPTVSRQLAELEDRLKTQLIRRTTHSLALTDAGRELLLDAKDLLEGWTALEDHFLNAQADITGRLKIVAPVALGQSHLARIAVAFQTTYPNVTLNWELEDGDIRFAEVGCDCWIKVGPVPDDTLIVHTIGTAERLVTLSPKLLRDNATLKTPKDIEALPFVGLTPFEGGRISLQRKTGRSISIKPKLRMETNNIFALKEAALAGLGACVLPRWFIEAELNKGRLTDPLSQWRAPTLPIQVAYLPGRHQPKRLRAFLDVITTEIPSIPGIAQNIAT